MIYQEVAPPADLRHVIHCAWMMEGSAGELGGALQPIFPDGRPELIVHFGDPFERIDGAHGVRRQAEVLFAGQLEGQLLLRPTGRVAVAGIRFTSCGSAPVLGMPVDRLNGRTVDLGDVAPRLEAIARGVRDETDSAARGLALLLERLRPALAPCAVDPRVEAAVQLIEARRGRVAVEDVAATTGLSRRHLERRFRLEVGISPKRLARIARFQHALAVLESAAGPGSGARTAAACGYADQAHFIRDFTRLAGCPPGEHLLNRGELTGFFTAAR